MISNPENERPKNTLGMHHIALTVSSIETSLHFYRDLLGMQVEWQPDADNVYLTSGNDNLALHKAPSGFTMHSHQRMDHLGFILRAPEDVDAWYTFLVNHGVVAKTKPRTHRDGARSFYCEDPDGNGVQMIYHAPIIDRLL